MLHWGGLKAFADGSLGSRTALMWEPYTDHNTHSTPAIASADTGASEASGPPEYGTRMMSLSEIESLMQGADAAGLSVAIHAIGERCAYRHVMMRPPYPLTHTHTHTHTPQIYARARRRCLCMSSYAANAVLQGSG